MDMKAFEGLISAIVLPMNERGEPDEDGLRRYVRWITDQGVSGVAVNVDSGEAAHLSDAEKCRVLALAREEIPADCALIAGVAGPHTAAAVAQACAYRSIGADALLVFPIPAFLSRPLDAEVPYGYHSAVAEVGLPLVLFQLQPSLAGTIFSREVLGRLLTIDGVVALKEASFDARCFMDTLAGVREAPGRIAMLTGNDNFIYESFVLGADGALLGFGAVMTREQVEMIQIARAGQLADAHALGRRIQRLADVIYAPPVSAYRARLKAALVMLGILDSAWVRAPLRPVGDADRAVIREALVECELL